MNKYLFLLLLLPFNLLAQNKLVIQSNQLFDVTGSNNKPVFLVDEQTLAGNPKLGTGGNPITQYTATSYGYINASLYYPIKVIIDLKSMHHISDFYVYDTQGSDSIKLSYGNPTSWSTAVQSTTDLYNQWKGFALNINTRYLEFEVKSPSAGMNEIVIYGQAIDPIPAAPIPQPAYKVCMNKFFGVNGFHNDPTDGIFDFASMARHYRMSTWDDGDATMGYNGFPTNQYAFAPSWSSTSWNFDSVHTTYKNKNIDVLPVMNTLPHWMLRKMGYLDSQFWNENENKPCYDSLNAETPSSYQAHADWLYQFAARYGKNDTIPTALLKLKTGQASLSGLNLIKYIENWNEPDKYWKTRKGFFTPYELAAMGSADRDGHQSTVSNTVGVKNADTSLKLVMGGLTDFRIDYLKAMKFWCETRRTDSAFVYDVLNFHHYSNNTQNAPGQQSTQGISPEADSIYNQLKALVNYRNLYLKNKEVWWTEFGYDVVGGPQKAPAIGTNAPNEVQAQWILRSYLIAAAAGIDKAVCFEIRDETNGGNWMFQTSGMTTGPYGTPEYAPRKSWYYTYTAQEKLNNTCFDTILPSGNPNVWVYRFKDLTSPNKYVYVLWCPTSNNTTVNNYALNIDSMTNTAYVTTPTNLLKSGVTTLIPISNHIVNVNVSERPVFISVENVFPLNVLEYKFYTEKKNCVPYIFIEISNNNIVKSTIEKNDNGVITSINSNQVNVNYNTGLKIGEASSYRIKMNDITGKTFYTNWIDVSNNCTLESYLKIIPNPIENKMLKFTYLSDVQNKDIIEIYSELGQQIYSSNVNTSIGKNEKEIDISTFAKGNYILKLISNNYVNPLDQKVFTVK
jgi:hypothetical protein